MEKNISAIIVEDEEEAYILLENKLKEKCPQVQVLAICNDKAEAIDAVIKYKPQLVFLDIRLGPDNGLDILEDLSDYRFEIIVISGHQEYVQDVVRSNAIDFLNKPYKDDELQVAVERVRQKLNQQFPKTSKIIVPLANGSRKFVAISDIVYCKSDQNNTIIYTKNKKKITTFQALSTFTHQLPIEHFFQTHRQFTVNLNYVDSFHPDHGTHFIKLEFIDEPIKLARRKKAAFFNRFYG